MSSVWLGWLLCELPIPLALFDGYFWLMLAIATIAKVQAPLHCAIRVKDKPNAEIARSAQRHQRVPFVCAEDFTRHSIFSPQVACQMLPIARDVLLYMRRWTK